MGDLVHDLAEVEHLVGDKQREMRGDVAESADAEHAPHLDQAAEARDAAERRDRERHAQEHQRPEAGAMDHVVDRPRAMEDGVGVDHRLGEREQQQRQRADAQRREPPTPVAPQLPSGLHGVAIATRRERIRGLQNWQGAHAYSGIRFLSY